MSNITSLLRINQILDNEKNPQKREEMRKELRELIKIMNKEG